MDKITNLVLIIPVLLFSVIAHEIAHGWVAYRNGDPTAFQLGRLSWNPARHIDPFMTILLPAFLAWAGGPVFGAAKPVPVNPRNYRHYKKGDIMVSLAGVTVNLILALLFTACIPLLGALGRGVPQIANAAAIIQYMFIVGVSLNLGLLAFNLLPVPPLDGSHVFKYILPPAWSLAYQRAGRFGFLILYAVLMFGGGFLDAWLYPSHLAAALLLGSVKSSVLPWPFPT